MSDASIRSEMEVFRSIMAYAAGKKYIPDMAVFKGKLPLDKVRREEFTPEEYRKLHTYARGWVKKGLRAVHTWYRTMAYNFILIMGNTGIRPTEAKNLLWRDVAITEDGQGRKFVVLRVRGKTSSANWSPPATSPATSNASVPFPRQPSRTTSYSRPRRASGPACFIARSSTTC